MRAHLNFWTFLGMFAGLITPDPLRVWGLVWCLVAMTFWGFTIVRHKIGGYSVIPILLVALVLPACAASNKAAIYTEEGLRSAEQGWDAYFNAEADRCEKLHEPKTPAMEACFGETYDADAAVATTVQSAVALLRTYWRRRADGEKPDLMQILKEVQALFDDLPPQAKQYFDRVKGIP
jgi:hypothetical protein